MRYFILFILFFSLIMPVFSKIGNPTSGLYDNQKAQEKLQKKLAKKAKKELKKEKREKKRKERAEKKRLAPRMVETREEWLAESTSKPRILRENPYSEPEPNKNLNPIEEPIIYFVKYNDPPGGNEANLDLIKKRKFLHSEGVATEDFKRLAFVEYSFNPEFNQITSELFILPLNENDTRLDRLKNPNLLLADRDFTFSSGKTELKRDMMSSLTIVDWNQDGSAVLIKEKTGSLIDGLYRTAVAVVYFDGDGITSAYQTFSNLEQTIKSYWREEKNIQLNFYRWDIKPLGWSAEVADEIISLAYAYTSDNKKTFLGAWAVNYLTGEIRLISLEDTVFDLSISGIKIKYDLDR